MKNSIFLILLLSTSTLQSRGETLVGSTGATNSIIVATNEAIIVDFIDTNSPYPIHRKGGASYIVEVLQGSAFAGPCELVFFNYSAVVTFHRVQTTAMTTVVLGANETNVVSVPTNKTLKIFSARGDGSLIVSRGAQSRTIVAEDLGRGFELSGPLTVTLTGVSSTFLGYEHRHAFSYFLTEDFLQVTADGYLRGPTGTFEVLVEKSTDLAQWVPVMVQSTATADTRAFYRLRIQK